MTARQRTVTIDVLAECQRCTWRSEARNALGNAARHHDAHGHRVTTTTTTTVSYGDAAAPIDGQTSLEDQ